MWITFIFERALLQWDWSDRQEDYPVEEGHWTKPFPKELGLEETLINSDNGLNFYDEGGELLMIFVSSQRPAQFLLGEIWTDNNTPSYPKVIIG